MSDERDEQQVPMAGQEEDAPAENPWIGRPHTFEPIRPPAVIHSLGDARPGEANPAAGHGEEFDGIAPTDTAALLAEREVAEENWQASYTAPTNDVHVPDGPIEEGAGEQLDQEFEDVYLAGQNQFAPEAARLDSKGEQARDQIQRAESRVGLPYEHSEYERDEMYTSDAPSDQDAMPRMSNLAPSDDDNSIFTVSATFDSSEQAEDVVRDLLAAGIAPGNITQTDEGGGQVLASSESYVEPAGEETYRAASTALPNDEDLATTVAVQADAPVVDDRGGLSRDEGLVPRIEAPADPQIYSDFAASDADYRSEAGEAAAQTGQPNPDIHKVTISDDGPVAAYTGDDISYPPGVLAGAVTITVQADRVQRPEVLRVLRAHGATDVD